jgi:hypothetical protein
MTFSEAQAGVFSLNCVGHRHFKLVEAMPSRVPTASGTLCGFASNLQPRLPSTCNLQLH